MIHGIPKNMQLPVNFTKTLKKIKNKLFRKASELISVSGFNISKKFFFVADLPYENERKKKNGTSLFEADEEKIE